jgi:hypothetical protein
LDPSKTLAEDVVGAEQLEMKTFEDPLFAVSVPKSFFTLRRTQKGDLPDAITGKGRRGSSIFTAGNMAKAEVIAVEVSLQIAFDVSSAPWLWPFFLSYDILLFDRSAILFESCLKRMGFSQLVILQLFQL